MITQDEFNGFISLVSKLKNQKTEKVVADAIFNQLKNTDFIFSDFDYATEQMSKNEMEKISYPVFLKYLIEHRAKRFDELQNNISKEDAHKFFNEHKSSDIGRDCIALIRKKLNGLITIDNYIAEMYKLEEKYPEIGFLEATNKLKHQIGVRV